MRKIILLFYFFAIALTGLSQETKNDYKIQENMFLKKKLFGFSFNNSWLTFHDLKDSTFLKPGLGLHADFNYFFNENWGVAIQAGVQMRGTGIITPDYDESIGNPDSTGRKRHSIQALELPVVLYYRTNKEIVKNARLIFGMGFIPMYHKKVEQKWFSVDDGFHTPVSYKDDFDIIDFPLRITSGLDVATAGRNLFRSSIIMDIGLKNNYRNPSDGKKSNKHFLLGIQLTFLM